MGVVKQEHPFSLTTTPEYFIVKGCSVDLTFFMSGYFVCYSLKLMCNKTYKCSDFPALNHSEK